MALPKLMGDRKGREALEDLLDDGDPHLRIDVVRALVELGDVKARPALRARLDTDLDARVRRRLREALRDLGGESKRATDQVREELDKLQGDHTELKARLAVLEARVTKPTGAKKMKLGKAAAKAAKPPAPAKKPKKVAKPKKARR
jgi:aminopeptidase N